ncbi:MAG TPA: zinc ABC transporter substrate-binding protein [Bacteroidales bacterium]|nr:zinc ABC transporter substrate-binding protein [Bacteroidales bacterium]
MKKLAVWLLTVMIFLVSCGTSGSKQGAMVITVSIPPFTYFVEAVADSDFVVNVMLPPGADHHSWEPLPRQITSLAGSEAFIINGRLGFELAWMDRFREINPAMKIIDLSRGIDLIEPVEGAGHSGLGHDDEGADPHYWLSPKEAYKMADMVRDLVTELNPSAAERYTLNYNKLIDAISYVDSTVTVLLAEAPSKTFMIFHPALAYMARDYGLEQISFEDEGKSPSPARMKELVDLTRERGIKIIFIQAEYDLRSAQVIAEETGVTLVSIDPMNSEWGKAVVDIAKALSMEHGARSKEKLRIKN